MYFNTFHYSIQSLLTVDTANRTVEESAAATPQTTIQGRRYQQASLYKLLQSEDVSTATCRCSWLRYLDIVIV